MILTTTHAIRNQSTAPSVITVRAQSIQLLLEIEFAITKNLNPPSFLCCSDARLAELLHMHELMKLRVITPL